MIGYLLRWLNREEASFAAAGLGDAADLATLHAESFHRGWSEAEFEQLLIDPHVLVDCASFGRELAGFVMSRRATDEAEILSVAVASPRRRRGLAGRLLALHLHKLGSLGVRRVFLEVAAANIAACRLYRTAGFHEVGRRPGYYEGGSPSQSIALVLRRDLG